MSGGATIIVEPATVHSGKVSIQGHKHSVVPLISAAVALAVPVELSNVPDIEDVRVLAEILAASAIRVTREPIGRKMSIDARYSRSIGIDAKLSRSIHGSIYLIPAAIARFGRVSFPGAGGCLIGPRSANGARPSAHILAVLSQMGAEFSVGSHRIEGWVTRLVGADVDVASYSTTPGAIAGPYASGVTKTVLIAAPMAAGNTRIRHPYCKQDVATILSFLESAGVQIDRGDDALTVWPVTDRVKNSPHAPWLKHSVPPDLTEVMTWVALGACCHADIRLENVNMDDLCSGLGPEMRILARMGAHFSPDPGGLLVRFPRTMSPVDIVASPDGIYSDHQPLFAVMLTQASGVSTIRDTVWPERFQYVPELRKLGANLSIKGDTLVVRESRLASSGTQLLQGHDVRAVAALLVAAMASKASVRVTGAQHLKRGYEDFISSAEAFGAKLTWKPGMNGG